MEEKEERREKITALLKRINTKESTSKWPFFPTTLLRMTELLRELEEDLNRLDAKTEESSWLLTGIDITVDSLTLPLRRKTLLRKNPRESKRLPPLKKPLREERRKERNK